MGIIKFGFEKIKNFTEALPKSFVNLDHALEITVSFNGSIKI